MHRVAWVGTLWLLSKPNLTCTSAERTVPPAAATAESKWRNSEVSLVAKARFFTYSVVEGMSLANGWPSAWPAVL